MRNGIKNRKYGELEVDENPVSSNGLCYATDRDTDEGYNVPHFWCNCRQPQVSGGEMKNIMEDKRRDNLGVCYYLMKLDDRWSNMPMAEGGYLTLTDGYTIGAGPTLDIAKRASKGITMTSVLFCRQGGIIYPINSGQVWIKEVINVKKEINALLEEADGDVRIDKVKEYIIKMKEENPDYAKFLEALYGNESRGTGGYGAVSGTYLGRYQLGDSALDQIGFKKDGKWTELAGLLGVYTKDDFLESETAQEVAVLFYTRWGYQYIISYGDIECVGTTIEEQVNGKHYKVEVTVSGLIAAGHLIGAKDLHKAFLGVKPWEEAVDGNGTNALKYMEEMGGFDLTGILGGIE